MLQDLYRTPFSFKLHFEDGEILEVNMLELETNQETAFQDLQVLPAYLARLEYGRHQCSSALERLKREIALEMRNVNPKISIAETERALPLDNRFLHQTDMLAQFDAVIQALTRKLFSSQRVADYSVRSGYHIN